MADSSAKVAAKKANYHPPIIDLSMLDLKKMQIHSTNDNRQMGQKMGELQVSQIQRACSSNM